MSRAWVLFMQFWAWLSNLGKIVPPVLDGSEAAREIHKQYFTAQTDLLYHQAQAEYHGAMVEMLYFRRKRLQEDPFCKAYFEPVEEDLVGTVPVEVVAKKAKPH